MDRDRAVVPIIETQRLRLRPFAASDAAGLHEAFGDAEAMRYWNVAPAQDLAVTAKNIEWLVNYSPYAHASWAVTGRHDGRFVGMVNYHHREARDRRLEIGYILVRRYWHQGLASEAVSGLLRHCFETLRTHRVEAMIAPENAASIRLVDSFFSH